MRKIASCVLAAILLASCTGKKQADLLVMNARIYTVDSLFTTADAMVIKDGKILATGMAADLQNQYDSRETMDAEGKFIYPGFIDAHAHFTGYGLGLQTANLTGTESWNDILEELKTFAASHPSGWIIGRGWDQNDWEKKEFPDNSRLNELFPDRPVFLERVDGHAAIVNEAAIKLAGLTTAEKITGGEVDVRNNKLTGVLIDNAVGLVAKFIPVPDSAQFARAMQDAQKNCFAMGLTTVDDCGLGIAEVEGLQALQNSGALKMRIYAMLSDTKENYDYLDQKGIIKTDRMHVRGFKVYGDGALGSRGACLLQPYSDKPGWRGFLLSQPEHFDSVAAWIAARDFQMCTHAIGDSGNRSILRIYDKYLGGKNDRRWRIEHAQVVNENDFDLFGKNNIIPSVQPTHATSDMYWAGERLGSTREKNAYAYKRLLEQNGWLPLGTDFPVEDISPFKTFLAATARKDAKGWPEAGYQPENALSREQTLRGMTIWAARSNFEEKEKGSLEAGKLADFIILDHDLMTVDESQILNVKVLGTFINGEKVH